MRDPKSLHKYAYVHGDPVQRVDPTGLSLISGAFSMGYSFCIRIGSMAGGFAARRGVQSISQCIGFEIFRLQMHLLSHWWKYEMGLMGGMLFFEVTGATAQWVQGAIDKALANERLLEEANIGEEFEKIVGANGNRYEAIDHLIDEPDGRKGIVSLSSVGTSPLKTDGQYIDIIKMKLLEKGR